MNDGLTPAYDWKKGAWKGVKTFALVAGPLFFEYFQHEENVAPLLGPRWIGLAGVLAGLAKFLLNYHAQNGD